MTKKVLSYGVIGLLAVALLAGSAYILLNPGEVQAGQGSPGGQGQGRGAAVASGGSEPEVLTRTAYGRSEAAQGRGRLEMEPSVPRALSTGADRVPAQGKAGMRRREPPNGKL